MQEAVRKTDSHWLKREYLLLCESKEKYLKVLRRMESKGITFEEKFLHVDLIVQLPAYPMELREGRYL